MAEVTQKEAKRMFSLEDVKFNKENALMAALSCIPIVGAIVFFVEKKDTFVRYYAAQYGLFMVVGFGLGAALFVLGLIPVVNVIVGLLSICVTPILGIGSFVLMIMGAMKAYKGERFDVPVLSKYAIELMNRF